MAQEDILPNCLTRTPKLDWARSTQSGGEWYYLYCANCGKDGGRVMATYLPAEFAFYLCNYCAETYGEVAGTQKIPDEVFATQVQQAIEEEYGHQLTELECLVEASDATSVFSMLQRDSQRRK